MYINFYFVMHYLNHVTELPEIITTVFMSNLSSFDTKCLFVTLCWLRICVIILNKMKMTGMSKSQRISIR